MTNEERWYPNGGSMRLLPRIRERNNLKWFKRLILIALAAWIIVELLSPHVSTIQSQKQDLRIYMGERR